MATGSPAKARMRASSWTMLPRTMFEYSRPRVAAAGPTATAWSRSPSSRRRSIVSAGMSAGRRQQARMGKLPLAGRVEDADLDRPDRPDASRVGRRRPGPRRPPGRTASCSRPGGCDRSSAASRAAMASASARVQASGFSAKTATPRSRPAQDRVAMRARRSGSSTRRCRCDGSSPSRPVKRFAAGTR